MPRIPRATDIGRAIPQSREQINVDFGGGSRALAAAVDDVASAVQTKQLRDRQNTLDDAELSMAIALEKESRAYDQDPDWQTISDRSNASMDQALGTIAAEINNAEDRQQFVARQKLAIERTRSRVQGVAWGKERDFARGHIDGQLDDARDAALTGEMGNVSNLVKRRLDSAVAKGYYGAEEADGLYRKWQESAAVGKLEMMEPEQRVEALKLPWADNLPADTRVRLQRAAEDELLAGRAQSNVDQIVDTKNMTFGDGLAVIDKMSDADERAATEQRFRQVWADREAAEQDVNNDLYDKYSLAVMGDADTRPITVNDIPREDWEAMPTTMRVNLTNLQASAIKPRTSSDPYALQEVVRLSAQGDYRGLKSWLATNGSLLSNGDREQYSVAAEKGLAPTSVTDKQAIDAITEDKTQRLALLPAISHWRNQYVTLQGKEPNPEQREAEIKRLIMSTGIDRPGLWTGDFNAYELEQRERDLELTKIHLQQLEAKNADVFSDTRRLMGGTSNRFEVEDAFNTMNTIKDNDPEGYNDVMEFIYVGTDIPLLDGEERNPVTYQQFVDTYERLLEIRSRAAN